MTDAAMNLLEIEDRVGIAGRLAEATYMATFAIEDKDQGNALRQLIGEMQSNLASAADEVAAAQEAVYSRRKRRSPTSPALVDPRVSIIGAQRGTERR